MKYIVATETSGVMKSPQIIYEKFELVDANTESEAKDIYSKRNDCSFYHPVVVGWVDWNGYTMCWLKHI